MRKNILSESELNQGKNYIQFHPGIDSIISRPTYCNLDIFISFDTFWYDSNTFKCFIFIYIYIQ